ncbi:hypothetical protein B0T11DRAFT_298881 [Plectosphaerella cucumerina]|uniref:Uncharacterized protein n=1 Tax=Plectosphaerella cucumerina TaxID=40658 RepID=A0A8K0TGM9_9PEZI|nr:hypothetical protein B0T11DRAFT_298881 [Plectosphaerella cucumerina]
MDISSSRYSPRSSADKDEPPSAEYTSPYPLPQRRLLGQLSKDDVGSLPPEPKSPASITLICKSCRTKRPPTLLIGTKYDGRILNECTECRDLKRRLRPYCDSVLSMFELPWPEAEGQKKPCLEISALIQCASAMVGGRVTTAEKGIDNLTVECTLIKRGLPGSVFDTKSSVWGYTPAWVNAFELLDRPRTDALLQRFKTECKSIMTTEIQASDYEEWWRLRDHRVAALSMAGSLSFEEKDRDYLQYLLLNMLWFLHEGSIMDARDTLRQAIGVVESLEHSGSFQVPDPIKAWLNSNDIVQALHNDNRTPSSDGLDTFNQPWTARPGTHSDSTWRGVCMETINWCERLLRCLPELVLRPQYTTTTAIFALSAVFQLLPPFFPTDGRCQLLFDTAMKLANNLRALSILEEIYPEQYSDPRADALDHLV